MIHTEVFAVPTFLVIELPDGIEPVVTVTGPVRELCRADSLAGLMNAIEDAGIAECKARHATARQQAEAGRSDTPVILQFRRGCVDALRGAGIAVAEIDDAS